ncbi:recombination regulator RecX [Psychrobacillus glaciei]|uniref:Regulatory protein RecX n=1 Tax=Psychrobacillus glaciei TaxID=2283160 RepID=A0A5J6SRR6_9BACI|nr:recombination regulator RecX [Psychrobacillus glaciei]QFG00184.1 recombination regulator RecX [Psychrobacillus glaciei]
MPIITKIGRQKNNNERYNLYLDEKYAFSVDEAVLIKYQLAKGKVIEAFTIDEIVFDDEVRKAYNKAINFLSYRMRSEHEVKQKLQMSEFGEAVILEAVRKLYEHGFLNDESFTKALVNTQKKNSKKGPTAIRQELKKKGIERDLQDEVLATYSEDEQLTIARTLTEKIINQNADKTPRQVKQKVQDSLQRKGYNFTIISQALNSFELEKEQEEWEDIIATQADKVWRKYASKYSGYDLKKRVKTALFQKGFPGEQIDLYIEKKELEQQDE